MSIGRLPNAQWAKWRQDFGLISESLMDLGVKRVVHRAHHNVLSGHEIEHGMGVVHLWMDDNYADSMLMGLRRIIDDSRGSFSLVRLLREIKKQHSLLTFEKYIDLVRVAWGSCAVATRPSPGGRGAVRSILALSDLDSFARLLYGNFSADGRTFDGHIVVADIDKLRQDHVITIAFINAVVAHRQVVKDRNSASGPSPGVRWEDLDRLFDDVAALFNKYYALVRPGLHLDFEPVLPPSFARAFERMVVNGRNG
jgi:AbiU2